jgi:hypothetical protein
MGSRRIGGVRFQALSGDHAGAAIPHLHAFVGGAEVIVELLPDGKARTSHAHRASIYGKVSASDLRRVIRIAEAAYAELIMLWRMSQP